MKPEVWTVFRHRDVTEYLVALREAGEEIRAAVKSLQHGVPSEAWKKQDPPETWEWIEARHYITFVVLDHEKRWIGVTEVESITVA